MRAEAWRRSVGANVMVTTACDRACPNCCEGDVVLRAKGRVFSPESIADDIRALGPIGVVNLSGGEPTLHPEFERVAELAREARGSLPLTLITNGKNLVKKSEAMKYFDRVDMSIFTAESNAGELTDLSIAEKFRAKSRTPLNAFPVVHTKSSGSGACGRELYTISTMAGRVYGCCVANGIDDAESTDLSPGWEERLLSVPLPCDRCVFGAP